MFSAENWKWVAEKLGIPTMFVLILCLAIYKTGSWTADHIFSPLVTQHIKFLEAEQEVMKSIAFDVTKQTQEQSKQTDLLKAIRDDQRKFPAVADRSP